MFALQASRMTTYLHANTNSLLGTFPENEHNVCVLPCSALCGGIPRCSSVQMPHARTARILLLLLIPGQIVFVYSICGLEANILPTATFLFGYIAASFLQVYKPSPFLPTSSYRSFTHVNLTFSHSYQSFSSLASCMHTLVTPITLFILYHLPYAGVPSPHSEKNN